MKLIRSSIIASVLLVSTVFDAMASSTNPFYRPPTECLEDGELDNVTRVPIASPKEIARQLPVVAAPPTDSFLENVSRDWERGARQTTAIFGGIVEVVGGAIGVRYLHELGRETRLDEARAAQIFPRQVTRLSAVESLEDLISYIRQGLIENLPSMVLVLVSGGATGALGKAANDRLAAEHNGAIEER